MAVYCSCCKALVMAGSATIADAKRAYGKPDTTGAVRNWCPFCSSHPTKANDAACAEECRKLEDPGKPEGPANAARGHMFTNINPHKED